MDLRATTPRSLPAATAGMDQSQELLAAEVDEPPDEQKRATTPTTTTTWAPSMLLPLPPFTKADPRMFERRESLLTRQLHSETEQTDEEDAARAPVRALSCQSTWSNPSVASTAELTSDDGHSVASPAISPPLPPTHIMSAIPNTDMALGKEPTILGPDEKSPGPGSEHSVEAGLGRKRCISFACGGNQDTMPPASQPKETAKQPPEPVASSASPPKRKCVLTFVCPTRAAAESRPSLHRTISAKRHGSPPPPGRTSATRNGSPPPPGRTSATRNGSPPPPERISATLEAKTHRGSDSTITHASPKASRKLPVVVGNTPRPMTASHARKLSDDDSDRSTEAMRFHEFASSDDEPEEWVQESTCHRSRLTVNDTLTKETILRQACEEVEEEVIEEENEDDDDDELDDEDESNEEDDEDDEDEEEESDDGFRTDDEQGFAESDSDGEASDGDWWRPGGALLTAATSTAGLAAHSKNEEDVLSSSVGSADSNHLPPRTLLKKTRRRRRAGAVPIHPRPEAVDLPDSTDFVCGTLDEDKPLEQAFINHRKEREAAKHKARPQDIDPTFPISGPELDEEDDEDRIDSEDSDRESLLHGKLDDLDGDNTLRRRPSHGAPGRTNTHHRSPPPPARRGSPAPSARKRVPTNARSPPPLPTTKRSTARSPPPRKLFGHSPKRSRSPAPLTMMTSPPNTRRASPTAFHAGVTANVLAGRPQLTHTSSLPRGGGFHLGKLNGYRIDDGEGTDTADHVQAAEHHKRGAIDIYKGLEKKRQRRKEKMHQKACAKAAAKAEKTYRVKPGKGAERMRELGLELQRYRGKGEHILSM